MKVLIELDDKIDLTAEQIQEQLEYEEKIDRCEHQWEGICVAHSSISEVRYRRTCAICYASQYGYGGKWDEPIGLLQAPRRDYIIEKFKAWEWEGKRWGDAQQGITERFWHGEWIKTVGGGYSLLNRKEWVDHEAKKAENRRKAASGEFVG